MRANLALLTASGPHRDEFADFDAASQPQRRRWSLVQVLQVFATLAVLLALAAALLVGIVGFAAGSPDQMILGTWVAEDHPLVRELKFSKDHRLTYTMTTGDRFTAYYAFQARSTVKADWQDEKQRVQQFMSRHLWAGGRPGVDWFMDSQNPQFKVRFSGREMVTQDAASGQSYRW